MATTPAPATIEEYIAGFPGTTQDALNVLLGIARELIPGATETIAYGMPTFDLAEKHVLHFAGFTNHVALYPVPDWVEAFGDEVAPYKSGQGTLKFALDTPLPIELIRRIVEFSAQHTS